MKKIINLIKENWLYLAGAILGGISGYLYWKFIGCTSGTCPNLGTLWGAAMGALLLGIFKKDTKKRKINN